jgi:hypothetical protein
MVKLVKVPLEGSLDTTYSYSPCSSSSLSCAASALLSPAAAIIQKPLRILARPLRKRKRPASPEVRTHKRQTNGVIRTVAIGKLDYVEKDLVSAAQSFLFWYSANRITGNVTDGGFDNSQVD